MRTNRRCTKCGGRFTGDHPQTGITGEYGIHCHVDRALAPLIEACWLLGITTSDSCQGGGEEQAYIAFPSGFAEAFATAATWARTGQELEAQLDDALDWRIYIGDPTGWRWTPGYPWRQGFAVHFPPGDIPELTRRLQFRLEERDGP